ncbi:kin of IRRE-like protein 1 [Eriocheir sinensis]|uniref:kin of IRRE-like protein 1 n=1 Tax=Eriocheir sinensis TaxID=95602 RepID=UPI0021C8F5FE|nr:kin of IRRE-like protein 1 [Eriocheir sinensis]
MMTCTPHACMITATKETHHSQCSPPQVSWIRRQDLHVLTTGNFTYTTDTRFRALHLPGSPFWSLEVDRPAITDSGLYECQVSTQPKIFRRFRLSVVVPSARITGSREIFMKAGSDINITCVVKGAIRGAPVTWYHVLPRDPPKEELVEINAGGRGGVQLVTDKNSGTSWLLVTHATWRDAGNYTCAPVHATPASGSVHVLDALRALDLRSFPPEEAPAELQNDHQPSRAQTSTQGTPGLPLLLLGLHRLLRPLVHGGACGKRGAEDAASRECLFVLVVCGGVLVRGPKLCVEENINGIPSNDSSTQPVATQTAHRMLSARP